MKEITALNRDFPEVNFDTIAERANLMTGLLSEILGRIQTGAAFSSPTSAGSSESLVADESVFSNRIVNATTEEEDEDPEMFFD